MVYAAGVFSQDADPICARLYMLVSFLKNANWITARGGKLFPKPIHDWQILQSKASNAPGPALRR